MRVLCGVIFRLRTAVEKFFLDIDRTYFLCRIRRNKTSNFKTASRRVLDFALPKPLVFILRKIPPPPPCAVTVYYDLATIQATEIHTNTYY
jgi:hypothetical protein